MTERIGLNFNLISMVKEPIYSKHICPVSGSISIYAHCDYFRVSVSTIFLDSDGNILVVDKLYVSKEFINMPITTPQNPNYISKEEFYELYNKVIKFVSDLPTMSTH
jgi:hypothetical protein